MSYACADKRGTSRDRKEGRMNYVQWVKNRDRELKDNHVFMVSGSELADMVIQDILDHFRATLVDLQASAKWATIDAVINQPMLNKQQVVILRDLETCRRLDRIAEWIEDTGSHHDRRTVLILTAATPRSKQDDTRWIPSPNKYVAFVDCAAIAEDHLEAFVQAYLPQATKEASARVVALCQGNVTKMVQEMKKLRLFDVLTESVVSDLIVPESEENVIEDLFAGRFDKIYALDPTTVSLRRIIPVITGRLRQQMALNLLRGKALKWWDMAKRADVPVYQFGDRMDELKQTTPEQITKRFDLLGYVDGQLALGVEVGLLHYLVLRWND